MSQHFAPQQILSVSVFAASISSVIASVNEVTTRLSSLSGAAQAVTLSLNHPSTNAAQAIAKGQALIMQCQCSCAPPGKRATDDSARSSQAARACFVGAVAIGAVKLWADAIKWQWAITSPLATRKGFAAGRAVASVGRALIGTEIIESAIEGVLAALAGMAAPGWAPLIGALAALSALLAGTIYLLWPNWTSMERAMRRLRSALSNEAMTLMRKSASVLDGESETGFNETPNIGRYKPIAGVGFRRTYDFASSGWGSVVAGLFRIAPSASSALVRSQSGSATRAMISSLIKVAATMLAVPLLITPQAVAFH